MTNRRKKALFTAVLACLLLYHRKDDYEYHTGYEIIEDESGAYARYRDGKIYIGTFSFLSRVDYHEGDVLVEDQRFYNSNPNFKIYNSCAIRDRECRDDIIEVLQKYEEEYPTPWERTTESMRAEWVFHNVCYDMGIQHSRTTNVDLNNADENLFHDKVLQKLFK